MDKIVRVAIFEDNYLLRDGFSQLINGTQGFSCTGVFDSANDVLNKVRKSTPDVILMDLDMPGLSGIDATRLVKESFPEIHIIIQTVFEDEEKIFNSILAGANGYILKKSPPVKILEAIKEVSQGGAPMTPAVAAKALQLFRKQSSPRRIHNFENLNERQKEILELIVAGMSYKMIAEKLFITVDTVRYHVKNIYSILQINSRYELLP